MRRAARRLAPTLALALGGGACTLEEGHAPVARILAEPRIIPEADAFHTLVQLDGRESADPMDDPQALLPLAFLWEVEGDEARFEVGGPTSPAPGVRFLGDRPATIRLTVTDADGFASSARLQLLLTVAPTGP